MFTKLLVTCGLILFLGGAGLGIYLLIGSIKAGGLTDASYSNACTPGKHCAPPINYTSELTVSTPTISEDQTVALTLHFSYTIEKGPQETSLKVTLIAPEFHFEPSTPTTLSSSGYTTLGWILSPTKPGTFQVGVQVEMTPGDLTDTRYIGINVTNVFGLSPWQIQLISLIGTFLGPVLTLGWWYDRWRERKRRKDEEVQTVTQGKTTVQSQSKATPQQGRKAKRRH